MGRKQIVFIIVAVAIVAALALVYQQFNSTEERQWQDFIRAALTSSGKEKTQDYIGTYDCPPVFGPRYGDTYYTGSLVDTHYHIPHFDSPPPWAPKDVQPYLGDNITISDIACTIRQENTRKVFAFFPVFLGKDAEQFLQIAKRSMELYPDVFVPFIMPPDRDNDPGGFPTVDAAELQEMLYRFPGLFKGFGEIGLYARQNGAEALPPDSQRLREIYPVIRDNALAVYFHLGEGHQENFERTLEQNPDLNFVWHGDQLIPYDDGKQNLKYVEEIISRHPNVFYTVDELYGDDWLIKPDVTKEQFLARLENYETLLEEDVATWKGIIERHPDQFMWGTDRSPQVLWSHDPDIGQALTNYGRAFIARLDPAVQEKFAYKNAERLLSK